MLYVLYKLMKKYILKVLTLKQKTFARIFQNCELKSTPVLLLQIFIENKLSNTLKKKRTNIMFIL